MEYTTLSPNNDPMGAAIRDYQNNGKASRLRVLSSMFDEDEMPVAHLFRTLSCEVMKERGVKNAECVNLFNPQLQGKYDTLLLLMNGTGIAGKLNRLSMLLNRLKELLAEGGQILIDSSDLKYIYENEDGSMDIDLNAPYYGEVDYQMQYKNVKGEPFDWLYTDPMLLASISKQCGLNCEIVEEGENYDFLARLF